MAAVTEPEVNKLSVSFESFSLEDVTARHRKEKKELQAKIQALKKNAPKNDKKKRKEAMEEVARLEKELEDRQNSELKIAQATEEATPASNGEVANDEDHQECITQEPPQQRVSKAQKRRDKKAREAQEREKEIRSAVIDKNSPKAVELLKLCAKLKERQLTLHHIPTDGDCLYSAIRHQLIHFGLGTHSVKALREETANYIIGNKDTLICYMTHPKTGELLSDDEFIKYCEDIRNTNAWGGQIELKALSSVLKVPIEVLQADGPPTLQGADEFAGPNLTITYHRHLISLGEHYNSTIPLDEANEQPSDEENPVN